MSQTPDIKKIRLGRKKEPAAKENGRLWERYRITKADYNAMFSKQGGKCAVCREPKKLVVDHDHASGRFRGLLCRRCNVSIGQLGDTAEGVEAAVTYLRGDGKYVNPKDLVGKRKVPILSVVPPASILYEALAMRDGAKKYGSFNWRQKKVVASIYVDALMRHLYAWWDGEQNATDSGQPHLGHAKACLGIMIDAIETGNLTDDRPVPGPAARLLELYGTGSTQKELPL